MAFESGLIAECAPDEVFLLLCTDLCALFKKKMLVVQNDRMTVSILLHVKVFQKSLDKINMPNKNLHQVF